MKQLLTGSSSISHKQSSNYLRILLYPCTRSYGGGGKPLTIHLSSRQLFTRTAAGYPLQTPFKRPLKNLSETIRTHFSDAAHTRPYSFPAYKAMHQPPSRRLIRHNCQTAPVSGNLQHQPAKNRPGSNGFR